MKLLFCYIENYGKLSGQRFDFSTVTPIMKENGAGKSTLASFLKAMFYGLDSYRVNGKEFSEREHFYPFGGGKFGGNLTFEKEGKIYRIERFFGEKNDKEDYFCLYCNDGVSKEFDKDIGLALFGIDRASFERTAFLSGGDLEISTTDSITRRLNRFLEGTEGDADFAAAIDELEKQIKKYKNRNSGLIRLAEKREYELQSEIDRLKNLEAALQTKHEKINRLTALKIEQDAEIDRANRQNELRAKFARYEDMQKSAAEEENTCKEIAKKYPHGIPGKEELKRISACFCAAVTYDAEKESLSFGAEETARLADLKKCFKTGLPAKEEIQKAEDLLQEAEQASSVARALSQKSAPEKTEKWQEIFGLQFPSDRQAEEIDAFLKRWRECNEKLSNTPKTVYENAVSSPKKIKNYVIIAVLCVIFAIAGGVLLAVQTALGAALAALGILGLFTDGFFYLNGKTAKTVQIERENPECRESEKEANELSFKISVFLQRYGFSTEEGLEAAFAAFCAARRTYLEDRNNQEETRNRVKEEEIKIAACESELNAFFEKNSVQGSTLRQKLSALRLALSDFERLTQTENSLKSNEEKRQAALLPLEDFCRKYELDKAIFPQALTTLENDLEEVQAHSTTAKRLLEDAASYKEKELEGKERPQENIPLETLQQNRNDTLAEITRLTTEISASEQELEDNADKESQLTEVQAQKEKDRHRCQMLCTAKEMLVQADFTLKEKYIRPVREKFNIFADRLGHALGGNLKLTPDFDLQFEENGATHSEKYLSAGQRSICALCFRLSLIAVMYENEPPFLVLDDPFINLDETNLQKAKELLNYIAFENRLQIVYFTCHGSREL